MKKLNHILILSLMLSVVSCSDWVHEPSPNVTNLGDFYQSQVSAIQNVNAAYVPLMWEFSSTYFSEFFIGDVVSDDALKGGQYVMTDMMDAYEMENWKTNTNNTLLRDYYRAKFQGIGRCNLVLKYVPEMDNSLFTDGVKERVIGEAKFLRAYYYFQLVRVFGGVPLSLEVISSSEKWQMPRSTREAVVEQILSDLTDAEAVLWEKSDSRFTPEDLGRATKGAAQAMLLKVNLYKADLIDNSAYEDAYNWGHKLTRESTEYDLFPLYEDNFTLAGENGIESVFEVQYGQEPTSDYGEGYGFTRGTFQVILTRTRSSLAFGETGWGFNRPTQNLYDEYEESDPRRDVTIFNPTNEQMENPAEEIYLGDRYCSRKYAMYYNNGTCYHLDHPTRGPINRKDIRFSDVLLMYAEACEATTRTSEAEWALERVRSRARSNASEDAINPLPEYPNYTIKINGVEKTPTLKEAIRHERRMELAMEGHRWYDLCRWKGFDGSGVKQHMDAYKLTETPEAQEHMGDFVAGKHELFPIPSQEIDLNPMDQNPLY